MDQQTVPVARSKKQKPARWESQAKGGIRPETLREIRRIAAELIAPFLLGFSEVMGVPSGLQAAYMGAVADGGKPAVAPLRLLAVPGYACPVGADNPWMALISWGLMLWGPRVLFRQRGGAADAVHGDSAAPGLYPCPGGGTAGGGHPGCCVGAYGGIQRAGISPGAHCLENTRDDYPNRGYGERMLSGGHAAGRRQPALAVWLAGGHGGRGLFDGGAGSTWEAAQGRSWACWGASAWRRRTIPWTWRWRWARGDSLPD